jgi:hypothetical protein
MDKAYFDNTGWWSNKIEDFSFYCDGAEYTLSLGYISASDPYKESILYVRLYHGDGHTQNSFVAGRYAEHLDYAWFDAHPNVRAIVAKEAERLTKLQAFI